MRFNFEPIILHCLGLCTQSSGLREVDLEHSPKTGSDKINMLTQGRKTREENQSPNEPLLTGSRLAFEKALHHKTAFDFQKYLYLNIGMKNLI